MSYNHRKKLNDHAKKFITTRTSSQFVLNHPDCNDITQKQHNPSQNDFILQKMYYDQIMKYLKKFGLNPKWNTKRLKKNNPIVHHALTTFFDRKGKKTQKKEDYFSVISKSSGKHGIAQQKKSDNNFYYPTDVILSFISWYIVWYISKYNINYDDQAMAFYMKHNHYWEEMLEEKNLNVKSRDAFYAKDWDFYTIACNILTNDDDDCIKIDNFLGIKIVDDRLFVKNNSNDDDENNEEDDGSKSDSDLLSMTGSMNEENEDVTEKKLDISTASTVGDISLILNQILLNICSDDKATIPDNIDLLEELEKMEKSGSAKGITFDKDKRVLLSCKLHFSEPT